MIGERVIVEGSAESIALRNKEAEKRKVEELIYEMKDEFPHLARMWEMMKRGKGNGSNKKCSN